MNDSWSATGRRADLFLPVEEDPRNPSGPAPPGDERSLLTGYLRDQRETLVLKCSGLGAADLARRSVEPSTMSLLGLVRHLADVERGWLRVRMAGGDEPPLFRSPADPDGDFEGAVADPAVVTGAWAAWREETAFTDRFVAEAPDLDVLGRCSGGAITLREVLVHLIEEYGRHNGHADLLRERIDGRVGE